jgi:NAD-dependent deacetylase
MAAALARVGAGDPDPACADCGGVLKPATVMFGEQLDPVVIDRAGAIAANCDHFLAVGTSLQVHPAAGLVEIAVEHGARLTVMNAQPTPYDPLADELVRDPIGTALPAFVARLLTG